MFPNGLYQLMSWFSALYPIGAFNYSHGIEYAVETNCIHNAATLKTWIEGILRFGSARTEAIFFKVVYQLSQNVTPVFEDEMTKIIQLSNALRSTPEFWLESSRQAKAIIQIFLATDTSKKLETLVNQLKEIKKEPIVSFVFAILCVEYKISLPMGLMAYLHAFVSNLVMAGIKLIPLGQTEGQSIIVALEGVLKDTVLAALGSSIEDIGNACPMVDWASVKHETQYTRLFQS